MINSDLSKLVWGRLIDGSPLDDLNVSRVDGRLDLRNLRAPDSVIVGRYKTARANVKQLGNLVQIKGGRWKDIDFSGGYFRSLRFFDGEIENCCFDGANCQDWRMWGTSISNTTFRSADLRRSALGGIDSGKRNSFRHIDFSRADFRQTAHGSADFVECIFSDTNLKKVDFGGSVFVRCAFKGKLDEVIFHHRAFRGEMLPANEMKGVDFRQARFHFVEFRGLDMVDVIWPEDDDYILLTSYQNDLKRILKLAELRTDLASKALVAILESKLKWAGPNQKEGVINKSDLIEVAGKEVTDEILRVVDNP
jgi:uncharacterized protein YjbI with pentapeptide repeats